MLSDTPHVEEVLVGEVINNDIIWKGGGAMEVFRGGKVEEVIAVRLDPGDVVYECVERIAKEENIQTGVIVSGIGTFDKARWHSISTTDFPPKNKLFEMEGPIEVSGISGIIADYKPHLHFTCANYDNKQVVAAHLEPGCKTLYLTELLIVKLNNLNLTRRLNQELKVVQLKSKI